MPSKKRNHIMPKCLLKQWETFENGISGVYVYNHNRSDIYLSASTGSKPFSFAIEPYFYVPTIEGERKYNLENWFADVENTLAIFLQKINIGTESFLLRTENEYFKFLLAIFSLKNRTKYDILKIRAHLDRNPHLANVISTNPEKEFHILVLENLVNSTTEEALQYKNCQLIICTDKSGELICGDRPFLFEVMDGFSFLALGPKLLLAIQKESNNPTFTYLDISNHEFKHNYNKMVAQNSIFWMISNKKNILEKYIEPFKEEKHIDTPYIIPPTLLQSSYKF